MIAAGDIRIVNTHCQEWNIPNFYQFCHANRTYFSPEFTINGLKWNLQLKIEPDYSFYLFLKSKTNRMVDLWYSISVLNHDTNQFEVVNKVTTYTFSALETYGNFNCTKQAEYLLKNRYIDINAAFTVQCYFHTYDTAQSQIAQPSDVLKPSISKKIPQKTCINKTFGQFLNNRKYSDVVFRVENEKFYAHKILLAQKSPVFAEMFQQQMRENCLEIKVDDVESKVFEILLIYIYTGKQGKINNDQIALKLFIVAHRYELTDLMKICEIKLCNILTIDNATNILIFSERYDLQLLKGTALDYLTSHAKDLVKSPEFQSITKLSENLLLEVISKLVLNDK